MGIAFYSWVQIMVTISQEIMHISFLCLISNKKDRLHEELVLVVEGNK